MGFGLEQADGSSITPMALVHSLLPLEAGWRISNETCGLDDVFPSIGIDSGP